MSKSPCNYKYFSIGNIKRIIPINIIRDDGGDGLKDYVFLISLSEQMRKLYRFHKLYDGSISEHLYCLVLLHWSMKQYAYRLISLWEERFHLQTIKLLPCILGYPMNLSSDRHVVVLFHQMGIIAKHLSLNQEPNYQIHLGSLLSQLSLKQQKLLMINLRLDVRHLFRGLHFFHRFDVLIYDGKRML